jgi:hypothetical protein
MGQQLSARLLELQTAACEAIIGLAKNVQYNRGRRSMPKSVIAILLAITLLALTSVASGVLADAGYSPGLRSAMMGNMGGGGMMRSMRGMMQGCSTMMQGGSHSGRPNEQWRDGRRSKPDRQE